MIRKELKFEIFHEHGDSGGPLAVHDRIVGIASLGLPCAMGVPDIFTRVSAYTSWIKEIMIDNGYSFSK